MTTSSEVDRTLPRRDRGAALVVATISLVVVTALCTLMLGAVDRERTGVVLESDRLSAVKLAEGVLEIAEDAFLRQLASYRPLPDPPVDAPFQVFEGDFHGVAADLHWTVSRATSIDASGVEVAVPLRNETDPVTGLRVTIEPHVFETSVTVGTAAIRMRRHVDIQRLPIFQFLAYYAGDLEVLPGPSMRLNGRIHTNSDLYMTAGESLTISSKYVKSAGAFHRLRKDGGEAAQGWIKIENASTGNPVTLPSEGDLSAQGIGSESGLDSSFTGWDLDGDGQFDDAGEMAPFKNEVSALFDGTFETGEHGVKTLQAPEIAAIQAYVAQDGGDFVETSPGQFAAVPAGTGTHSKSYFHENADLVVIDDRVFDESGTDITASMPSGFVTQKNVWDQREGRTVSCIQIDLGRLGDMDGNPATYDPCPHYPTNGLLFATKSSTAGQPGGVVLTNAAELNVPSKWNLSNYAGAAAAAATAIGATVPTLLAGPAPIGAKTFTSADVMGLTVVTPQPAYVHGDYNTVAKKPAAVISDTVNLLSNAWDFTKTTGQEKTASDTAYNLAMILGHRPTVGTQYSGGFENLPRFHENWSGKTCTIRGSFVSPWFSGVATGNWVYGGAWYSAPNRVWSFETMFDQGNLPPFTPMVVTAEHVAWELIN
jgi:hypothetical protein